MKKIAFLTSGGDAPGMNATIRAVTRACVYNNLIPVGVSKGFDGLINGDFLEMNARSVKGIINKGGTILKTARSKGFRSIEGRKKAYDNLKKNNIDGLIIIGGDGSFTGGLIFQKEFNIPVIGICIRYDKATQLNKVYNEAKKTCEKLHCNVLDKSEVVVYDEYIICCC